MARDVEVKTSAACLADFERKLGKHLDELSEDAQRLDAAYHNVEWNDMVSERTRIELNGYIDKLNRSLAQLEGVILAVGEMRRLAEEYEGME